MSPTPASALAPGPSHSAPGLIDVSYALASIRKGCLLENELGDLERAQLEGLAAILPDLFATVDRNCLDRIAERLGSPSAGDTFDEILLLSGERVHVIQLLVRRAGLALLAVSPAIGSIGLVLSAVHARAAALEAQ